MFNISKKIKKVWICKKKIVALRCVAHNTNDLIANVKKGQTQINESFDNLFAQLKNIGIEI